MQPNHFMYINDILYQYLHLNAALYEVWYERFIFILFFFLKANVCAPSVGALIK